MSFFIHNSVYFYKNRIIFFIDSSPIRLCKRIQISFNFISKTNSQLFAIL